MAKTTSDPGKGLLKLGEAARYMSMSPWLVRKLVQDHRLRVVRIEDRGPWWIAKAELDRFIETHQTYI